VLIGSPIAIDATTTSTMNPTPAHARAAAAPPRFKAKDVADAGGRTEDGHHAIHPKQRPPEIHRVLFKGHSAQLRCLRTKDTAADVSRPAGSISHHLVTTVERRGRQAKYREQHAIRRHEGLRRPDRPTEVACARRRPSVSLGSA
jgi:hypothetical protein